MKVAAGLHRADRSKVLVSRYVREIKRRADFRDDAGQWHQHRR